MSNSGVDAAPVLDNSLALAVAVGLILLDGVAPGVLAPADGVGDADGVADGVALGVADGVALGVADGVGLGVGTAAKTSGGTVAETLPATSLARYVSVNAPSPAAKAAL